MLELRMHVIYFSQNATQTWVSRTYHPHAHACQHVFVARCAWSRHSAPHSTPLGRESAAVHGAEKRKLVDDSHLLMNFFSKAGEDAKAEDSKGASEDAPSNRKRPHEQSEGDTDPRAVRSRSSSD